MRPEAADTAPIRFEERFDEARVATYLHKALPDLFGSAYVSFAQFPGGRANLTYLAAVGDDEYVLRRPPLGETAPGAHDMEREYRVLSHLWPAYPRAPRAFHFCADPSVMGKPFFVMERRYGWVVRDEWPDGFSDAERFRTSTALVDGLVELHRVDVGAVGLKGFGRPGGFVERQVDGWSDRWARAQTRSVPAMDAVAEQLRHAVPAPQAVTLLHNDYKLDNTMVDERGEIVAVLDWDMATTGDPLVDLGTMLAYWASPDDVVHQVFGANAVSLTPYMDRDDAAHRYGAGSGFDLSGLEFYLALAFFRIAVIVEQIYARYVAGQTTDSRFARMGEIVPQLASTAQRALTS